MIKLLFFLFLISNLALAREKISVLEIDTGIDRSHEEINSHLPKNPANILDYEDFNGHGTHVAGLILTETCPEVELESCSYFDVLSPKGSEDLYIECLKLAVKNHPDIVNISAGGEDPNPIEFDLIKKLSDMGTKIVVAAGNSGKDLSIDENNYYPAKYKILNLIPVGNLGNKTSNYGLLNEVWEYGTKIYSTLPNNKYGFMSGTSQSTAKKTNSLLLELCKHERN